MAFTRIVTISAIVILMFSTSSIVVSVCIPVPRLSVDNHTVLEAYFQTHDPRLLAPDAELIVMGMPQPFKGQEDIHEFLRYVYSGWGRTLGVKTNPTKFTAITDTIIMVEFSYHGTFYPDSLVTDYRINLPMTAIFEVIDGHITREILFDGAMPDSVHWNYVTTRESLTTREKDGS